VWSHYEQIHAILESSQELEVVVLQETSNNLSVIVDPEGDMCLAEDCFTVLTKESAE
jgi:hypothetical protein